MRAVNQIPLFRVSLEARDRLFEALTNFLGRFFQKWVVNRQHGGHGIDRRDFDGVASRILNDDIAREHGSNLVFELERVMGKSGIASAKDAIVAKLDPQLFLEGFLDVDLGDDAETLLLQGFRRPADRVVESRPAASC